ncbi:MAG TPA: GAF domain-containing protein [Candidatus Acidoferrales bacterium]|nr:GAF domain-containing protein [Candidatus Acidoferrales bacterium]
MSGAALADVATLINGIVHRGTKLDAANLEKIAEAVGQVFSVHPDEVAVLALTEDGGFLRFRVPQQLQTVGQIPMTSNTALAVRTAREKRAEIVNHFNIVRHASVFEGVRLNDQRHEPIQKIMSAPIVSGGKVLGVLQISRKAKMAKGAKDFSQQDLKQLVSISDLLAPALPLWQD